MPIRTVPLRALTRTGIVAALILVGGVADAFAQARGRAKRPAQRMQVRGRLHSWSRDVLKVVVPPQQTWLVKVDKQTSVKVTGLAGRELLRPGLPVRFHAMLNERGQATGPISRLEVFTPEEGFVPTIVEEPLRGEQQEPGADGDREGEEDGDGESNPVGEDAGEVAKDSRTPSQEGGGSQLSDRRGRVRPPSGSKQRADKRERATTAKAIKRYFISGTIRGIDRKGRLQVQVGRVRSQVQVAQAATVEVESSDFRLARPGDQITADVTYYQPGKGLAREIAIQLDFSARASLPQRRDRRDKDRRPEAAGEAAERERRARLRGAPG